MKNIIFIPGYGETCDEHTALTDSLKSKGHKVKGINPDWKKPLSECTFPVDEDSILIGFSFGAVIAYHTALNNKCKEVILCSLSPIETYSFGDLYNHAIEHMNHEEARSQSHDLKNMKLTGLKTPHIFIKGENEIPEMKAHVLVPKTDHVLNKAYIKVISSMI